MVVLEVWEKYHCVCIVVIDLTYVFDLLWDYPIPDRSNPLIILLDSTCDFSFLPATRAQDL